MTKSSFFKVVFFVLVVGGGLVGAWAWLSDPLRFTRLSTSGLARRSMKSMSESLREHRQRTGQFPASIWFTRKDGTGHPAVDPATQGLNLDPKNVDWNVSAGRTKPPFGYVVVNDYAILVSVGPDQDFDTAWSQIDRELNPADQTLALLSQTYDPTNGTKSNGDVYMMVEQMVEHSSSKRTRP